MAYFGNSQEANTEEEGTISGFWQEKYRRDAAKSWDIFYKRNTNKFFKDRHWIIREFPEVVKVKSLLEVGCGVGNFILPLLQELEAANNCGDKEVGQLFACDFSPNAIEILKNDPRYKSSGDCKWKLLAFVCNIVIDDFPQFLPPSLDAITMIFVLSAIPPEQHQIVFRKLYSLLGSSGCLLFRDYMSDDAAHKRFKPDRHMGGRLWVRQDGTFAYYFTTQELVDISVQAGFTIKEINVVERETINQQLSISLDRKFIQAKFIKSPQS